MPTSDQPALLTRRRSLQWLGVAAVSGLLAACQQAAPSSSAPAPTSAPPAPKTAATAAPAAPTAASAPQAAPTTASTARTGGSFVTQLGGDPTMNPVVGPDSNSNWVNAAIFNQLTRVDKSTLQPSPDLALSWAPDADGMGWTFNLRPNVTWHDGQPFSADDVKYTFDRILDPNTNTRLRGDFSVISEVQVKDPATVYFKLARPFSPLPVFMSYTAGIVPKHLLENRDINTASEFNSKKPVGTGPFMIKEYVSGSYVTLSANPNYFRGKPKLDSLTFKIVPDINTITAQLNTGELEFAKITPNVTESVANNSDLSIYNANFMNWSYVGPNLTNPLFQDKRVRQAIAYGIDKQAINAAVGGGRFTLSSGPIPPFLKPWHDDTLQPYAYDPNKASQLFAEAGWTPGNDGILQKDGQPFRFKFAWGKNPLTDSTGVLVQQYLKKMGMDAQADPQEWNAYIQRFENRDYEMLLDGWVAPYDPDVFSYFHSSAAKGGKNITLYSNADVDALLEQGRAETDATKRQAIYNKLQAQLYEDQPTVFLWHPPELQVRAKKIGGLPAIAIALGDLYKYSDEFTRVA